MLESGIIMQINDNTMTVQFEQAMLLEVQRIGDAAIGDKVQVQLPENTLMQASVILYGIPLIVLIVGLLAGFALPGWFGWNGNPDVYAALCGLGLAGITFLIIRLTEHRRSESGKYAPQIVSVEKGCPHAQMMQNQ